MVLPRWVAAVAVVAAVHAGAPVATAADCVVIGAVRDYWQSVGGPSSFLGPCRTDEQPVPGGVVQQFTGGSVYWSSGTGAREVHGSIREHYDAAGGSASLLRLPVTHETPTPSRPGAFNHFQGGSVYWSPATGAWTVHGAVRVRWSQLRWENGPLGFPVSDELPLAGGAAVSHFEGGSVYWSPTTGAQVVHGSIRQVWQDAGAERSPVGLPTTDELPTPVKAGAYNHFERGSAYWSPTTGAHLVYGAVRERWAALGWENSWLGFPVSGEYGVPGGRRSDFQGGSLVWDAASGRVAEVAGTWPAFSFSVAGVTAADLPYSWRSGCPVGPADLRLVRLTHVLMDGRAATGELVLHRDAVQPVLRAFARLYDARFPVQRMQRVDAFGGSDAASMDADNSSAFNCRRVSGSTAWSEHAYGRALDLNPVQNPWVSGGSVSPAAGRAYLDRADVRPGMVVPGDVAVRAFADQGWGWGGAWSSSKDYQHFSASGR